MNITRTILKSIATVAVLLNATSCTNELDLTENAPQTTENTGGYASITVSMPAFTPAGADTRVALNGDPLQYTWEEGDAIDFMPTVKLRMLIP